MTEQIIERLILKADSSIENAKYFLGINKYDDSVSESYYSMFYHAEALLLTKNLKFSKHSAVESAIGQYFSKTGEIKPDLHKMLIQAGVQRIVGDYDCVEIIPKEDAEKALKNAEYFASEIKPKLTEYLKNNSI